MELLKLIIDNSSNIKELLNNDSYSTGVEKGFVGKIGSQSKVPSGSAFRNFLRFCFKAQHLITTDAKIKFITLAKEQLNIGLDCRYTNAHRRLIKGDEYIEFWLMLERSDNGET